MTTLSPAETCRKVADIIDFESERFDMNVWSAETDCGTVACIAGHASILHSDELFQCNDLDGSSWIDRQAARLGVTSDAGDRLFFDRSMFWRRHNIDRESRCYSQVLRQLGKELEDRGEDDLIDVDELEQIAEEALW